MTSPGAAGEINFATNIAVVAEQIVSGLGTISSGFDRLGSANKDPLAGLTEQFQADMAKLTRTAEAEQARLKEIFSSQATALNGSGTPVRASALPGGKTYSAANADVIGELGKAQARVSQEYIKAYSDQVPEIRAIAARESGLSLRAVETSYREHRQGLEQIVKGTTVSATSLLGRTDIGKKIAEAEQRVNKVAEALDSVGRTPTAGAAGGGGGARKPPSAPGSAAAPPPDDSQRPYVSQEEGLRLAQAAVQRQREQQAVDEQITTRSEVLADGLQAAGAAGRRLTLSLNEAAALVDKQMAFRTGGSATSGFEVPNAKASGYGSDFFAFPKNAEEAAALPPVRDRATLQQLEPDTLTTRTQQERALRTEQDRIYGDYLDNQKRHYTEQSRIYNDYLEHQGTFNAGQKALRADQDRIYSDYLEHQKRFTDSQKQQAADQRAGSASASSLRQAYAQDAQRTSEQNARLLGDTLARQLNTPHPTIPDRTAARQIGAGNNFELLDGTLVRLTRSGAQLAQGQVQQLQAEQRRARFDEQEARKPQGLFEGLASGFTSRGFNGGGGGFGAQKDDVLGNLGGTAGTLLKYTALSVAIGSVTAAIADEGQQVLDFTDSLTDLQVAFGGADKVSQSFITDLSEISRLSGSNVAEAMDTAARGARAFRQGANDSTDSLKDTGLAVANVAAQLALITNKPLQDATGDIIAIGTAYGLEADSLQQVNDAIAGAKNLGGDPSNISQGLANFAISAKEAGFTLNEAADSLSLVIARTDESGQTAATRLSRIFAIFSGSAGQGVLRGLNIDTNNSIKTQISDLAGQYENLGSAQQAQVRAALGGTANVRELLPLLTEFNRVEENSADAAKRAGEGQAEFNRRSQDLTGTIRKISGDLKNVEIGVFRSDALAPFALGLKTIEPLVHSIAAGLNAINDTTHALDKLPPFTFLGKSTVTVFTGLTVDALLFLSVYRRVQAALQSSRLAEGAAGAAGAAPVLSRTQRLNNRLRQVNTPGARTAAADTAAAANIEAQQAATAAQVRLIQANEAAAAAVAKQTAAQERLAAVQAEGAGSADTLAVSTVSLAEAQASAGASTTALAASQTEFAAADAAANEAMRVQARTLERLIAVEADATATTAELAAAQAAYAEADAALVAAISRATAAEAALTAVRVEATAATDAETAAEAALAAARNLGTRGATAEVAEQEAVTTAAAEATAALEAQTVAREGLTAAQLAAGQTTGAAAVGAGAAAGAVGPRRAATIAPGYNLDGTKQGIGGTSITSEELAARRAAAARAASVGVNLLPGAGAAAEQGLLARSFSRVGGAVSTGASAIGRAFSNGASVLGNGFKAAGRFFSTGFGFLLGAAIVATIVDQFARATSGVLKASGKVGEQIETNYDAPVTNDPQTLRQQAADLRTKADAAKQASGGFFGTLSNAALGDPAGKEAATARAAAQRADAAAAAIDKIRSDAATGRRKEGDHPEDAINAGAVDGIKNGIDLLTKSGRNATTIMEAFHNALDKVGRSGADATGRLGAADSEILGLNLAQKAGQAVDLGAEMIDASRKPGAVAENAITPGFLPNFLKGGRVVRDEATAKDADKLRDVNKDALGKELQDANAKLQAAGVNVTTPEGKKQLEDLTRRIFEKYIPKIGDDQLRNEIINNGVAGVAASVNPLITATDPGVTVQEALAAAPDVAEKYAARQGFLVNSGLGDANMQSDGADLTTAKARAENLRQSRKDADDLAKRTTGAGLTPQQSEAYDDLITQADNDVASATVKHLQNLAKIAQQTASPFDEAGTIQAQINFLDAEIATAKTQEERDALTADKVQQEFQKRQGKVNATGSARTAARDPRDKVGAADDAAQNARDQLTFITNELTAAGVTDMTTSDAYNKAVAASKAADRTALEIRRDEAAALAKALIDPRDQDAQLTTDINRLTAIIDTALPGSAEAAQAIQDRNTARRQQGTLESERQNSAARVGISSNDLLANDTRDIADLTTARDATLAVDSQGRITKERADAQRALDDGVAKQARDQRAAEQARLDSLVQPGDDVAAAQRAVDRAQSELKDLTAGNADYYAKQAEIANLQRTLAQTQLTQAQLVRTSNIDRTNPVQVALDELQKAKEKQRLDIEQHQGQTVLTKDKIDVGDAAARADAAQFQQNLSAAQIAEQLGRSSHATYLQYLKSQHDRLTQQIAGMKVTDEGYQQAIDQLNQIDQLTKDAASSLQGQFNLGDIKLPSVFEVRRSLAAESAGGTTTSQIVNNTISINGADTAEVKRVITGLLGPSAISRTPTSAGAKL